MTLFARAVTTALVMCASVVATGAHHSVAGEFDASKPVTIEGVLTRVKWESPHVWIYVQAKDTAGKALNWAIECAPPAQFGAGVRDRLRIGEAVTVNAYRARDAARSDAHAYDITVADGSRFVIGLKLHPRAQ